MKTFTEEHKRNLSKAKIEGYKSGKLKSWNKGQTKETNNSIKKISEGVSKTRQEMSKRGELKQWCKGLTKDTNESLRSSSKKLKGRKFSKETIEKMSKIRKDNFAKGKIKAWNKGLTKNTDQRIAKYGKNSSKTKQQQKQTGELQNIQEKQSQTMKKLYAIGEITIWCEGLTKETHPSLVSSGRKASLRNRDWTFYNQHGTLKSRYPYNSIFNYETKQQIREKWGNKCVVTGMTSEEHKQIYGCDLHIHHWTYNKEEEDTYFMLPVCNQVNMMANGDKEEWMSIFGGIAEEGRPLWEDDTNIYVN